MRDLQSHPDTALCLSEYRMDRHLLQMEDEQERASSMAHLAGCARCQQDKARLEQAQRVPLVMPASKHTRWRALGLAAQQLSLPVTWAAALGALCVLVLFVADWTGTGLRFSTIRGLAKPALLVVRKRQSAVEHVPSGASFYRGDFLRVGYRWASEGYLTVVHRDIRGAISPLYPTTKSQVGVKIKAATRFFFPGSLEVEGQPTGDEEIWACFSRRPHSFAQVAAILPPVGRSGSKTRKSEARAPCLFLTHFLIRRPGKPR